MKTQSIFFDARYLCILIVTFGTGVCARAQIVIDGTLDAGYGQPLAIGNAPTSSDSNTGNIAKANGSEIDATYATIQTAGGVPTLYGFFAGNLDADDHLDIFIQTGSGGTSTLATSGSIPHGNAGNFYRLTGDSTHDGNGNPNRGLEFNSSFSPNYALILSPTDDSGTTSNIYVDNVNLNSLTQGSGADFNPGPERTVYPSSNLPSLQLSLDNSNTGGVGTASASGQASVNTGIEFSIALSDITEPGQTVSDVKLTGIITDSGQDIVTNQVTGLPGTYVDGDGNTGSGSADLGDPTYGTGTNFNVQTGLQYVDVPLPTVAPEPSSLGMLAIGVASALRRRRSNN